MSLASDVAALRDRVLADLESAYDYYTETKIVWNLVEQQIKSGHTFSIRLAETGTVSTEMDLLARAPGYISGRLAEATFQQFVSIFEGFYVDLLRLWLIAHPQSLSKKTIDVRTVLESPDKESIVLAVVNHELNEVLYRKPAEWFAYLEDRAKLGYPTLDEVARIVEAKAARDVLVHNRGVANTLYMSKAGVWARFSDGERVETPDDYHRATWSLIRKVVADVSDAAIAKAS